MTKVFKKFSAFHSYEHATPEIQAMNQNTLYLSSGGTIILEGLLGSSSMDTLGVTIQMKMQAIVLNIRTKGTKE